MKLFCKFLFICFWFLIFRASDVRAQDTLMTAQEAIKTAIENNYGVIISKNEIALNSNGSYNWRIVDMSGPALANGRTTSGFNVLQTGSLNSGMYLLQIIDGGDISTEKIVKQ